METIVRMLQQAGELAAKSEELAAAYQDAGAMATWDGGCGLLLEAGSRLRRARRNGEVIPSALRALYKEIRALYV